MTGMTARILPAPELADLELRTVHFWTDDGRLDDGSRDGRSADLAGPAAVGQQHLLQLNRGSRFRPLAVIDQEGVAFLDPKLAAALSNNCKHGFSVVSFSSGK